MTDNQQANQERTPTRTKQLVRLIEQSGIEFFKDSHEGHAYLNVQRGDVFHTWSVDSADFKAHIRDLYESEFDDIASSSMIHETQRRFIDMAIDMVDHPVHVRSAGDRQNIYIDLGDSQRQCIHISPEGWSVIPQSARTPRFRVPFSTIPLPTPEPGGSIDLLWEVLPIERSEERAIVVGCILSFLFPSPPSPILVINGEAGSGKTTVSKIITNLIDPISQPLPAPTSDTLYLAARGAKVICLDNISGLNQSISDDMARLVYGAENLNRKLYTNGDTYRQKAQCGIILNGIPDFISQPDLADRCFRLNLRRLREGDHKHLSDVMNRFKQIKPRLLGVFCDALSTGLRNFDQTPMPQELRLKEIAQLVEAASPSLGLEPEEFTQAAIRSRHQLIGDSLEACPVSDALSRLLDENPAGLRLTPSKLLESLEEKDEEQPRNWPRSSKAMTQTLQKNIGSIREQLGFDAEYIKSGQRWWVFTPIEQHQKKEAQKQEIYQERMAICIDSGISDTQAHRIAQAEADNCADLNGGVH